MTGSAYGWERYGSIRKESSTRLFANEQGVSASWRIFVCTGLYDFLQMFASIVIATLARSDDDVDCY